MHIERHLGCHFRQPFREKVRCSHPALDGAERMFRCLTTYRHFFRMLIEACLHSFEHGLVLHREISRSFPVVQLCLIAQL